MLSFSESQTINIAIWFLYISVAIKEEQYNPKGVYVKPPSELKHTGKSKGIQGHQNSCYLDATLYGMFAFSDAFDDLFLQDVTLSSTENNKAREIQEIIQEQIVYRLRL